MTLRPTFCLRRNLRDNIHDISSRGGYLLYNIRVLFNHPLQRYTKKPYLPNFWHTFSEISLQFRPL